MFASLAAEIPVVDNATILSHINKPFGSLFDKYKTDKININGTIFKTRNLYREFSSEHIEGITVKIELTCGGNFPFVRTTVEFADGGVITYDRLLSGDSQLSISYGGEITYYDLANAREVVNMTTKETKKRWDIRMNEKYIAIVKIQNWDIVFRLQFLDAGLWQWISFSRHNSLIQNIGDDLYLKVYPEHVELRSREADERAKWLKMTTEEWASCFDTNAV